MIGHLLGRRLLGVVAATVGVGALLFTAPALAASPTISVSPSSGLTNGQSVTVKLSGFTPKASVAVIECSPLVAQDKQAACDTAGVKVLTTDASGAATTPFTVKTGQIGTASGSTCPGQGGVCLITAANTANQAENTSAQVTFASAASPSASPTPVPGATTPTTGKPLLGEILVASALVVLGGGLLFVARRRAAHH
jgi:hypothetical protein